MKTFKSADILIPKNVDFTKWSVVACDQYTSEPEYWEKAAEIVGDEPSTLNIIFPEVYLDEGDNRIKKINKTMDEYIDRGIFNEYKDALIYVERNVGKGRIRKGLVGCIDLEDYDFNKGSGSLVRATEGTVLERIPPRVKIRENAKLELPHVMILIDDEAKRVIEPLANKKNDFEKLYNFELMQESGSISGYLINDEAKSDVYQGIEKLFDEFEEKYKITNSAKLIFAVGDGNHSLATAKTCWENIKKNLNENEIENHPARYALCELVNIHDAALEFEPIHRVVFDIDADKLISQLSEYYDISTEDNGGQHFEYVCAKERKTVYINNPSSGLSVGTLQNFLDSYVSLNGGKIDYIHGDDVTVRLGSKEGNIGFILPAMGKNELFGAVISDGALPRKTFSMGEAFEKRFYLEAKRIVK
ncbi:MAG: DUF1015 domain-containing protein [Clostridia bacterium]|nr:DUF1015 domain-containing protein [Clostridia bacterium]